MSYRPLKHCCLLVALVAPILAARAETWYVHAQLGNDENPGTESLPLRTLARLAVLAGSGDSCRIAGTFRNQTLSLTGVSYCTVEQWQGQAPAIVRADVPISDFEECSGAYSAHIPSGMNPAPAAVVVDWDTSADSSGRRLAHLRRVSEREVESTDYSFNYDDDHGTLKVRLDGSNPNDHSLAYVAPGRNAFWFRSGNGQTVCTANTVRNITFALWADSAPGRGNGILMENSRGCVIDGCRFEDSGFHAWSFPSGICEDNTVRSCFMAGFGPGGIGGAFYAGGAGISQARVSARAIGCTVLANGFLDPHGDPIFPFTTAGGFISHTDGINGNLVSNVEYSDCVIAGYQPPGIFSNRDNAFYSRDAAAVPSRFIAASYPVRAVQCKVIDGASSVSPGSIAFDRCQLHMTRAGRTGVSASGVLGDSGGARPGTKIAFFSTEIVVDLDGVIPQTGMVFNCRGETELVLVNSSVFDRGIGGAGATPAWRFMLNYGGSGSATAVASVFAYRTLGSGNATRFLCANDNTVNAAQHNFDNCAMFGITKGFYSGNSAFNSESEWEQSVDANAVFALDIPFLDVAGGCLDLGPALREVERLTAKHVEFGVNGCVYDGHIGAWQYGQCPADFDADGFLNGSDFDEFVQAFETGLPEADFDEDGFISGADFDSYVTAFEAGCA